MKMRVTFATMNTTSAEVIFQALFSPLLKYLSMNPQFKYMIVIYLHTVVQEH